MKKKLVVMLMLVIFGTAYAAEDVTSPDDPVIGQPDNGDWPENEAPGMAIDNDPTTKFLHFRWGGVDTGIIVTPQLGTGSPQPTCVQGLTFTTGNDAPERDPVAYELYGSNDSNDGPWTEISSGPIEDFEGGEWPRQTQTETPIVFENDTDYTYYRLLFTKFVGEGSDDFFQISEVELLEFPDNKIFYIENQPQDQDVLATANAVFEVGAYLEDGNDSDLDFQWYKSDDDVAEPSIDTMLSSSDPKYSGVTEPNLTIVDVNANDDQGYYFCEVTNPSSSVSIYSRAAYLNVVIGKVMGDATVTEITGGEPSDYTLPLPEDVIYAVNQDSEAVVWQDVNFTEWDSDHPFEIDFGDQRGPENMNWSGTSADDVAAQDIAGTFVYGDPLSFSIGGLTPSEVYDVNLVLALGDSYDSRSVRINMFGNDAVEDSIAILDLEGDTVSGGAAPAYIVSFKARAGLDGAISGQIIGYDNTAEGGFIDMGGVLSAAVVSGEDFALWKGPESQAVAEGETAELGTKVLGNVDVNYQWYDDFGDPISGATSSVLTLENASQGDEGSYFCEVSYEDKTVSTAEAELGIKRLRAHWTLDSADYDYDYGEYIDVTGNASNIWEFSFDPNFVTGIYGDPEGAVHIDPNTGYGDITGFNPTEYTDRLTVSFWLNWDGTNGNWQTLVAQRDGAEWSNDTLHWVVDIASGTNNLELKNTAYNVTAGDAVTDDGQWQYIVASFDGTTGRIYVDGQLQAQGDFALGEAGEAPIGLGALAGGVGEYTNGAMDDVRIYNYALTDYQIAQMYYDVTGETACASPPPSEYDRDGDCDIDTADLAEILTQWLETGIYGTFEPNQE